MFLCVDRASCVLGRSLVLQDLFGLYFTSMGS